MRRHLWAVMGLVLLGVCVWLVLPLRSSDDFGWFAYTPLSSCRPAPGSGCTGDGLVLTARQSLGGLVGVLGLVVIASGIGFRLGQRRQQ